ncbi:hypothetical protein ACUOEB_000933 [Vibrio vulnificus]|uniref:hypothetical protein n=1 Tax=Vibrio TaxID=662 RepID=UPI0021DA4629|nr:hypothetical protein [Vibrio vulnificus]MCU8308788.1 hypothetical protein [Vibrio vulnificus]HCE2442217.1 hypothetical protein [Vibrio parahaemolyticus]
MKQEKFSAVEQRVDKILKAIDNNKYKARTVAGIASEVKLPETVVQHLLESHPRLKSQVIQLPGVTKGGERLYVSLERYKHKTPITIRILNLLRASREKI